MSSNNTNKKYEFCNLNYDNEPVSDAFKKIMDPIALELMKIPLSQRIDVMVSVSLSFLSTVFKDLEMNDKEIRSSFKNFEGQCIETMNLYWDRRKKSQIGH